MITQYSYPSNSIIGNRLYTNNLQARDMYFRKLSNHDFFIRGLIIYIIALCLIAWLSFYIFSVLDYQYAKILSKVFILIGLGYVVFEYIKHKDEIIKKLNRLHG
ncbi:hypothetical protein CLOSPI_00718 [Thomasclavelia spiroformis DSM 1552]|uniref:Uncharacterized protein n=2 Tax=Thomasclavelia spiroformis TaxID=29348 RepID=B1C0I9_9FIRM|nr:hypothetical protein CLOSPI_00718 [Thomasclavelia spiroformis DSM 1552]